MDDLVDWQLRVTQEWAELLAKEARALPEPERERFIRRSVAEGSAGLVKLLPPGESDPVRFGETWGSLVVSAAHERLQAIKLQ